MNKQNYLEKFDDDVRELVNDLVYTNKNVELLDLVGILKDILHDYKLFDEMVKEFEDISQFTNKKV
jgi:hypothetical protein